MRRVQPCGRAGRIYAGHAGCQHVLVLMLRHGDARCRWRPDLLVWGCAVCELLRTGCVCDDDDDGDSAVDDDGDGYDDGVCDNDGCRYDDGWF